jgi:hypothetical protein
MRSIVLPVLLLAASADARAFEVVHEPVDCVPPGRYTRVVARGNPATAVASAEAQFRTHATGDWYRVRLSAVDGGWEGLLPQPTASLSRFEYRVVLTGTDASTSETGPIGVDVSPEGCPLRDDSAAQGSIVVLVPPGAPIAPPVPAGFSPVGASVPEGERRLAPRPTASSRSKLLVIGTGVVAGGAVAALAGGGSRQGDGAPTGDPLIIPRFTFTTVIPPPGSPVSFRSGQFGVVVTMDKEPSRPLPVDFRVLLMTSSAGTVCAAMNGRYEGALRPLGLVLNAPLSLIGQGCGEAFEVQYLLLFLSVNDRTVLTQSVTLERPVRFEP